MPEPEKERKMDVLEKAKQIGGLLMVDVFTGLFKSDILCI